MFYSHTILAKKAPLGTVWIAAHLERRIKKSQIDEIDIETYTLRIAYPEVPIALRLSAHLLLGIVKIYSLKVNYLLQDCNSMKGTIGTVFPAARIDLPPDADRAPFEFLTKPDNFQLDAFELDDGTLDVNGKDDNVTTYSQITMTDQGPDGEDPYAVFHINEAMIMNPSPQKLVSNPDAVPMDVDVMPPFDPEIIEVLVTPPHEDVAAKDPGPGNEADVTHPGPNVGRSPQDPPETEVMRDTVHNFEGINRPDSDYTNENDGIDRLSGSTVNRNGNGSPISRLLSDQTKGSMSFSKNINAPTARSPFDPDVPTTGIYTGLPPLNIELHPSPQVEKQKPKPRKKKEFFDEFVVLSNVDMKKQLDDTSKLVRKRSKLPCSALDSWRGQKIPRKDCILPKTLISGMCADLQEVFERQYPLLRIDSAAPLEPSPVPMNSDIEMPDINSEIEHPRFVIHSDTNIPGQVLSPSEREQSALPHISNRGSSPDIGMTSVPEIPPTVKKHVSAEPFDLEPETPLVPLGTLQHPEDSDFPEIPSLLNSADIDEFNFLEASNNTSSGFGESEVDAMSARTRAVAQYFKELSPATESLGNQSGNICLNAILTGKKRKQCAQMFFETLVLKTTGFIEVKQEEPYGDILISQTPALVEAKF